VGDTGAGEETATRARGGGNLQPREAAMHEQVWFQSDAFTKEIDAKRAPPSQSLSPNHTGGRAAAHQSSGAETATHSTTAGGRAARPWPGSMAEPPEQHGASRGVGRGRGLEGHAGRTKPSGAARAPEPGGRPSREESRNRMRTTPSGRAPLSTTTETRRAQGRAAQQWPAPMRAAAAGRSPVQHGSRARRG
jgi:hypothetical protein